MIDEWTQRRIDIATSIHCSIVWYGGVTWWSHRHSSACASGQRHLATTSQFTDNCELFVALRTDGDEFGDTQQVEVRRRGRMLTLAWLYGSTSGTIPHRLSLFIILLIVNILFAIKSYLENDVSLSPSKLLGNTVTKLASWTGWYLVLFGDCWSSEVLKSWLVSIGALEYSTTTCIVTVVWFIFVEVIGEVSVIWLLFGVVLCGVGAVSCVKTANRLLPTLGVKLVSSCLHGRRVEC